MLEYLAGIWNLNLFGANIPYPYDGVPMISGGKRIGFWAMLGAMEALTESAKTGSSGYHIDGGKPRGH